MRALGVRVEQSEARVVLSADPGHSMQISGVGERRAEARWMWSLEVSHPGLDEAWVIEPEDATTRVRKLIRGQDVLTGDEAFDDAVHVLGDERLLASLGHHTRDRLTGLLPQARLAGGTLRWSAPATGPRPPGLIEVLRDMTVVVRVLSADLEPLTRLRKHMLDDARPGHRRRALERVVMAGHVLTAGERRALLRDPDPRLRLTVARMLHDPPALGRLAADARVSSTLRDEAVDALGECTGPATVEALDRVASSDPPPDGARLARALGRGLAGDPTAIRRLGDAALSTVLEYGPAGLRGEAIERLAEVGTERAVPALAAIAGAFFGRRAHKDRARAAIERIAARQGGLRAGGLSVTEAGGGALSPAEDG